MWFPTTDLNVAIRECVRQNINRNPNIHNLDKIYEHIIEQLEIWRKSQVTGIVLDEYNRLKVAQLRAVDTD